MSTGKISKRIVLITSGQPTLNPRLVKEADALVGAGYSITVIYKYWNAWATELDIGLLSGKKWKAVRIGGDPERQKIQYWLSRFTHKVAVFLCGFIGASNGVAELAIGRVASLLTAAASREKADLYIAHNLAALPAAVKAAKNNGGKCGFDAEDFHRFETSDDQADNDVILKTFIEDKYIRQTNYFTASSPEIAIAYNQLYPSVDPTVIYNVFPRRDARDLSNDEHSSTLLRLFWFSQTIGDNRGLNDIVMALKFIDDPTIELHLLGDTSAGNIFIEQLNNSGIKIKYYPPMAPDVLIDFSSQFDIGLALEPGFCTNNNLALSNKIFTYLQAGLAIIASDTLAQHSFMNTHPAIGKIYQIGQIQSLVSILKHYKVCREELNNAKTAALQLAHKKFNWEQESIKFIELVKDTLGD